MCGGRGCYFKDGKRRIGTSQNNNYYTMLCCVFNNIQVIVIILQFKIKKTGFDHHLHFFNLLVFIFSKSNEIQFIYR